MPDGSSLTAGAPRGARAEVVRTGTCAGWNGELGTEPDLTAGENPYSGMCAGVIGAEFWNGDWHIHAPFSVLVCGMPWSEEIHTGVRGAKLGVPE